MNHHARFHFEVCSTEELAITMKGEISSECIHEVMKCWKEHESLSYDRVCIVDLSLVKRIDEAGESVIRHLASCGARFRGNGPIMGCVIDLVCKESKAALLEGRHDFKSIVFL
jgi:ABC-type transporter Mla MlaB component